MHSRHGRVKIISPGAQNLQSSKSVLACNTSLQKQQGTICKTTAPVKPASLTLQAPGQVAQHEDNLYKLINITVSRQDANSDGGQVNA